MYVLRAADNFFINVKNAHTPLLKNPVDPLNVKTLALLEFENIS
jgi:hypothetical protein